MTRARQSADALKVLDAWALYFRDAAQTAAEMEMVLRPRASIVRRRDGGTSITLRWGTRDGSLSQTATLRLRPAPDGQAGR